VLALLPEIWDQLAMAMAGKNVAVLVEFNYEGARQSQPTGRLLSSKQGRVLCYVLCWPSDLELWYPLLRFREEGATTFTVGPKAGMKYAGKHSYPVVCDKCIDDVSADDIDVLIIPVRGLA
jgi:hypothetical protein